MRAVCTDADGVERTAVRAIADSQSSRLSAITHASNEAGERYGERVLGPIRDRLPRSELQEAYIYTSGPVLNRVLRFDDPGVGLNWMRAESERYRRLRSLTDSHLPEPEDITRVLRNPELPSSDRALLESILSHPAPTARVEELFTNFAHYDHLWEILQSRPSLALIETRVTRMDRAVAQPLPDSVRAVRGLESIDHLVDQNGIPIGARDPALLRGVVQKERGYSSTSLGAAPPDYYARGYRLELDVPAGSHGLWMGQESRNIYQRELILPRDLEYRIDEVIPNPSGKHYEGVDYLFRATVIPPGV
ncbi:ADP-ribosyltransferase [Nocardia sp. NPDC056000]|uniref:ADP-ribosyltransferase n=1 Tax=Nocardia sp. NPDC056000 TaxID=3345674 RepID=UPI0035DD7DC6